MLVDNRNAVISSLFERFFNLNPLFFYFLNDDILKISSSIPAILCLARLIQSALSLSHYTCIDSLVPGIGIFDVFVDGRSAPLDMSLCMIADAGRTEPD